MITLLVVLPIGLAVGIIIAAIIIIVVQTERAFEGLRLIENSSIDPRLKLPLLLTWRSPTASREDLRQLRDKIHTLEVKE